MTVTRHAIHPDDQVAMAAMRDYLAIAPKPVLGPEARPGYDALIALTPSPEGVAWEAATVGGIPGWWVRPAGATPGVAILYLHGGAFVLGSAEAYRGFAGQIAFRAGAATFVADYALAPERPFPAALEDAQAALRGLSELRHGRIALAGDSAGGGLALALLASADSVALAGAAVMSPWTDVSLASVSMETRAGADPLLSREALAEAARLYIGYADPHDPRASALYADLSGSPPVLIHVGEDEVLLDDALRYGERLEAVGGQAEVHVWAGMVHVFPSNLALRAAGEALAQVGAFLRDLLANGVQARPLVEAAT